MCGIAGIVRIPYLLEEDKIHSAKFLELLKHRGPDNTGTYVDAKCSLIQTQLALVDLKLYKQPMGSRDGRFTLLYNGQVYNWRELKAQLSRDFDFQTETDTEVVLAALISKGPEAISDFDGMFSFFLWDSWNKTGIAACDKLAVKPFFFCSKPGYFAFASEAGALIESGAWPFRVEEEAIIESLSAPYFSGTAPCPFQGISRLEAGNWISLSVDTLATGQIKEKSYYRFSHKLASFSETEIIENTERSLASAVEVSMRAATDVGIFLSGGIDSSLIALFASKDRKHKSAWTIKYENNNEQHYSNSAIVKSEDLPFARLVANKLELSHEIIQVSAEDYERALLKAVWANDLIAAWEQEVSQFILAEAASKKVKAVVVGDAADELHFGYSFLLKPSIVSSPKQVIETFGTTPLNVAVLGDPTAHFTEKYMLHSKAKGFSWKNFREQQLAMSCLVRDLWLPRLLHNGDIHLMHHAVEGRVPFANQSMLNLAEILTPDVAYKNAIEKWHLRKVSENYFSEELTWRPKSSLPKNLIANGIIHKHFSQAWREYGGYISKLLNTEKIELMAQGPAPVTEKEVSICFRILATLTWFRRFAR